MENPFKNLFKKKEASDGPVPQANQSESNKSKNDFFSKIKSKFGSGLKSRLGKNAVQGEEIVGVELAPGEIRLSQVSNNKSNQWVLDKFYVHKITDLPEGGSVLENPDKYADELKLALQKSKITTTNAAIAIPVTSAIIRVVTAPLMTDEELKKAIDTDSLWENLVQLTDNLNDYSIFHQVINRDKTANTMDILFVASKLSDINSYTEIIKKGGLNAVIIDVKCFALKSAVDQINQIAGSIEDSNLTAVLEFGLDENYIMILYENNPIITDIFIRGQDRTTLRESNNQEENTQTQAPDTEAQKEALLAKTFPTRKSQRGLASKGTWDRKYEGKVDPETGRVIIAPPRPPAGGEKTKEIPIRVGLLGSRTGKKRKVTEAEYWDITYGETHDVNGIPKGL